MKWINACAVLKPSITLAADYDVQLQIEDTIKQLNILWNNKHVKGHHEGPDLPWEATLNTQADELATEARATITPTKAKNVQHLYPAANIHLMINNNNISRNFDHKIQNAYTIQYIKDDMCKQFDWSNPTYNKIDWRLHGANITKLPFYEHRFTVKCIHERLPVLGKSFNPSPTTTCPCC
eukprot:11864712-Ditylum_brightwellii.AAC.1